MDKNGNSELRARGTRAAFLGLALIMAAGGLLLRWPVSGRPVPAAGESRPLASMAPVPEYLYVWAGDARRIAPDRVVTIDYDPRSPRYGEVIGSTIVPGPGGIDNEPHHCMLSANQKILACGGLLSVLRHQDGIFFFDVSHPATPRFLFSTHAAHSSVTDAFVPLPSGGFLVTQMGSASGGTPGRVLEIDGHLHLVHEWPDQPPTDGFNPHGIDVRPDLNLMLTSDFVDPASTLNVVPGPPLLRGSVRVWDLRRRAIVRTIHIPGAPGTMDTHLIPHDPQGRGYTAGVDNGLLYLLDTAQGTARPVFDFNALLPGASPQVMVTSADGRRLFVPLDGSTDSAIALLDITDPADPHVLDLVRLGRGAGPHMTLLTDGGTRLVVSDYFLNEDTFGKVHADGDHRIRVFNVTPTGLRADLHIALDFNTAIPGLQLRPHGIDVWDGGVHMATGSD
jgi:selenium-binding protein 1